MTVTLSGVETATLELVRRAPWSDTLEAEIGVRSRVTIAKESLQQGGHQLEIEGYQFAAMSFTRSVTAGTGNHPAKVGTVAITFVDGHWPSINGATGASMSLPVYAVNFLHVESLTRAPNGTRMRDDGEMLSVCFTDIDSITYPEE